MLNLLITYMNNIPTHWCSFIFPVTELDMIVHGQVIFKSQKSDEAWLSDRLSLSGCGSGVTGDEDLKGLSYCSTESLCCSGLYHTSRHGSSFGTQHWLFCKPYLSNYGPQAF